MLIGLLDNGNVRLDFKGYYKILTKKQWQQMWQGQLLVATGDLTEEEFQQLHENIEAKRTGNCAVLLKINREIIGGDHASLVAEGLQLRF